MKALSPPKSPLIIAALQLGLLVLTIYYTFIGGQTAQGIYDHHWRLITLWLTTLLIGSWLLLRLIGRYKIPRTPFDLPLLFLFAAWLLATLFSVNPVYSQETMVFFIIYIFVFYLAADLGRWPWLMELTFNAVIAVSGLVWTLAAWQLLHWYQNLPPLPLLLQGHPPPLAWLRLSVLGNPNTMASYIALVFPIVLYKLTSVRRLISRILLLVWLGLLLAAALLTQSRGGIVGLVVAGGFFLLVWAWSRRGNGSPRAFFEISRRPAVWLLVLAGLVLGGWLLLSRRDVGGAVGIRQQVMVGALKTWQAQPLLGSGPGTLGEELLRRQQSPGMIWPDAHNLLLTLTAETGLVGLIGLLWLTVVGVKLLWATLRQPDKSTWPLASLACLAALLGFMAHNLVDSLFKFPLIMLLVAVWAGFWVSASPGVPRPVPAAQTIGIDVRKSFLQSFWAGIRRHLPFRIGDYFLRFSPPNPPIPAKKIPGDYGYWPLPVTIMALLILAAMTVAGASHIRHIAAYNQAVAAADQYDWTATRNYLQQAVELAPQLSFYRRQLGLVSGYLSTQHDPAGSAERQQAIDHYRAALAGLDHLAVDHANLACLLGQAGQPEAAAQELALALELEPNQPLYALNLGYYREQLGDYPAAWAYYADVLAARPDYLPAAYWSQTQPRREARPAIIVAAAQKLAEREVETAEPLLQLFLYAGNLELAWQVYEQYVAGETVIGHLARGRLLLAEQRLAEAQAAFESALALDPAAGEAYLGLSQIALAQQRVPEAVQLAEAALFLTENPDTLYQTALALTAAGADTRAIELYEAAFMQLTAGDDPNLARYATEVARRRPLPLNYLPCLIQLYPTQRLIDLTLAEGKLLEQQGDYTAAGQVYQRLLALEPQVAVVRKTLETLCHQQPQGCDLRANE